MDNNLWFEIHEFVQFLFPVLRLIRLADSDLPVLGKVYYRVNAITKCLHENKHKRSYFEAIYDRWIIDSANMVSDIHLAAYYCLDIEFWDVDHFSDAIAMEGFRRFLSKAHIADVRNMETSTIILAQFMEFKLKRGHYANPLTQYQSQHVSSGYNVEKLLQNYKRLHLLCLD